MSSNPLRCCVTSRGPKSNAVHTVVAAAAAQLKLALWKSGVRAVLPCPEGVDHAATAALGPSAFFSLLHTATPIYTRPKSRLLPVHARSPSECALELLWPDFVDPRRNAGVNCGLSQILTLLTP